MISKSGRWIFQIALAAFIVFMAMYYHQASGANANSRLLLVYGLIENGSLQADPWAESTIDKAVIDGHAYCDKAPFSSLLVAPFYALWRIGGGPQTEHDRAAAFHIATLVASAIPFAIFGLLLLRRLEHLYGRGSGLIWVLCVALFGTFVMQFASGYFGHVLGGLLMVAGFELVFPTQVGSAASDRPLRVLFAGVLGGLSVATEYPLFITQLGILIGLMFQRRYRSMLMLVLGGLGPAVGLLIYNFLITGHALKFPYQFVPGFPVMEESLGLGSFSFEALWGLTFSLFRGTFIFAPSLLVLMFVGPAKGEKAECRRSRLVAGICLAHLAFFSTYQYWDGGGSAGPRFLIPATMLLIYNRLPYVFSVTPINLWNLKIGPCHLWLVLGFLGIGLQGLIAAIDALTPAAYPNPILEFYWPCLLRGQFNPHTLLIELGLPRSYGAILFRSWYVLIIVGGLVFTRWYGSGDLGKKYE